MLLAAHLSTPAPPLVCNRASAGDFVFMSDNRTLVFTTLTEDTHRPDKVGLGVWDGMLGGLQPVCSLPCAVDESPGDP